MSYMLMLLSSFLTILWYFLFSFFLNQNPKTYLKKKTCDRYNCIEKENCKEQRTAALIDQLFTTKPTWNTIVVHMFQSYFFSLMKKHRKQTSRINYKDIVFWCYCYLFTEKYNADLFLLNFLFVISYWAYLNRCVCDFDTHMLSVCVKSTNNRNSSKRLITYLFAWWANLTKHQLSTKHFFPFIFGAEFWRNRRFRVLKKYNQII